VPVLSDAVLVHPDALPALRNVALAPPDAVHVPRDAPPVPRDAPRDVWGWIIVNDRLTRRRGSPIPTPPSDFRPPTSDSDSDIRLRSSDFGGPSRCSVASSKG
jgi:hypothetical protein